MKPNLPPSAAAPADGDAIRLTTPAESAPARILVVDDQPYLAGWDMR
jgi:hypothetical protein